MAQHGIKEGDVIKGFCNGYFGRDSFDRKTVESIGDDWVVCRNSRGKVEFYAGDLVELAEAIVSSNADMV